MIISSQDWCSVQNSVALWLCVFVLILLGWITIYLALRVYSTGKFFHHWIQFSCTHPTFCMLARFHTNGLCLHCVCSSSAVAFSNSGGKTCMIWVGLDFTLCIVIFSDFFKIGVRLCVWMYERQVAHMKSERFPRLHTNSECYHSFCDQSVRLLQFMVECAWFHDGNCNSSWPCAALAGSKALGVHLGWILVG